MLKGSIKARSQPAATVAALKEVVEAAETVDTANIHKEALAAIEELKQQGPGLQAQRLLVGLSSARPRSPAAASPRRRWARSNSASLAWSAARPPRRR